MIGTDQIFHTGRQKVADIWTQSQIRGVHSEKFAGLLTLQRREAPTVAGHAPQVDSHLLKHPGGEHAGIRILVGFGKIVFTSHLNYGIVSIADLAGALLGFLKATIISSPAITAHTAAPSHANRVIALLVV